MRNGTNSARNRKVCPEKEKMGQTLLEKEKFVSKKRK